MTKSLSRRKFIKRIAQLGFGSILLSFGGYSYARYIEPRMLRVNRVTIASPDIPKSFNGISITQFSDTHLGHHYTIEQFKELISKVNELNSDLVFFTGDLIDEPNRYDSLEAVAPILQDIRAPLGKYAIYGNHDHGGYGSEMYKKMMEQSNFKILMNQHTTIKSSENESIVIAGLDDLMLGKPDIDLTLEGIPTDQFIILMAHEPDVADEVSTRKAVNLQVSGHSHGGQVQIPFIGPLITPPYAVKYVEGFYELPDTGMTLYVNRGIGTTREPYRFFSIPEITVFTLVHEEQ